MQRKRDGLVPIGEAFGGLGGPVKVLRDASPQAVHHYTRFDQVNALVSASEADPDRGFMALLLARLLANQGRYDPEQARKAYVFWLDSGPFDCGMTIASGLRGRPNSDSQANGAMMRISPVGIFGANHDLAEVADWARQDAALTYPHPVCRQANALYAMAIAEAVRAACDARYLYERIAAWAEDMNVHNSVLSTIRGAAAAPPTNYIS